MKSQNGWLVNPSRSKRKVPGTDVSLVVVDGPGGDVLMHVAKQFHDRVENLVGADNGGYNYRTIAGTRVFSNHASATAIDLEWNDHPYGRRGSFTKTQVKEIRDILNEVDNVVGWGGDWGTGSVDEMHFELRRDYAAVEKVAARLASNPGTCNARLTRGMSGDEVRKLQSYMNRVFPAYSKLVVDGEYGPKTEAVVREFQSRTPGLHPSGAVDAATWSALGF